MSQENAEVVRAAFEAWNAGRMDAVRDLYDPNAIMIHLKGWPEPGPTVGREEIMRQWERQRETWDLDTLETLSDFIEAGDRVVVRVLWRGRGRGPDMDMEMTGVYTVRKGKFFIIEHFWDHAEALEAVGLPE